MINFTSILLFIFLISDLYALITSYKSMSNLSRIWKISFVVLASATLASNFIK